MSGELVRRSLVAAGSLVVLAMAVVHVAVAEPTHASAKHAKPKPVVDAGPAGENPYGDEPAAPAGPSGSTSGGASAPSAASDAGPPPPPIAHIDLADGGIKPSPLNPTAAELPPQTTPPAPDYDKLLGDVSALRARVAAVTDTLFRSRVAISLEADGSHAKIGRLSVSLDDGVVYTAPPNTAFERATKLYEHGVAPGRHAIIVDVDRKDDRDDTFRTSQRSRFLVDVPKDQQLEVTVEIDDDSSMGKDFPSDHSGRYDLRVRAKATAKPVK
ncbi:MAG: hypothetical protein ACLQVI_37945 [Polyangiaceae bacterium]